MTLADRIANELDRHYGGWLDNGNTDKVHCPCGHRPARPGESHSRHVAEAVVQVLMFHLRRVLGFTAE